MSPTVTARYVNGSKVRMDEPHEVVEEASKQKRKLLQAPLSWITATSCCTCTRPKLAPCQVLDPLDVQTTHRRRAFPGLWPTGLRVTKSSHLRDHILYRQSIIDSAQATDSVSRGQVSGAPYDAAVTSRPMALRQSGAPRLPD
jgi:hypothetical protein